MIIAQHWADLTFIHWPVRQEHVAHLYPPGTRPDIFADGMTYAGLVPFTMRRTAFASALPIPYFGTFHETNIRLYSIDDAGRHGVLFRSLETARLAVVPVSAPHSACRTPGRGCASNGPVTASRMTAYGVGHAAGLRSRLTVAVGGEVKPTALETWLTARWGAHTRKAGQTWWVPNEHGPWPLHAAEVIELDDDLLEAGGIVAAGDRLRALYSPGTHARFGRPSLVK